MNTQSKQQTVKQINTREMIMMSSLFYICLYVVYKVVVREREREKKKKKTVV